MSYFAHSGTPGDKSDWQLLKDHSEAVARLAAEKARPFGLERPAFVAGLLHDLGKYDPAFQRRLEGANIRVDHSTAGAVMLMERTSGPDRWIAELVGYCVLGHHAGLPDKHTADPSCFRLRREHFQNKLDPAWEACPSSGFLGQQAA